MNLIFFRRKYLIRFFLLVCCSYSFVNAGYSRHRENNKFFKYFNQFTDFKFEDSMGNMLKRHWNPFPKGSALNVEWGIKVPIFSGQNEALKSSFEIKTPISIQLDKVELLSFDRITRPSFSHISKRASGPESSNSTSSSEELCSNLFENRQKFLSKAENVMDHFEKFNKNSLASQRLDIHEQRDWESCTLRIICEAHSYRHLLIEEWGLWAELFLLIVSFEPLDEYGCGNGLVRDSKLFLKYVEAQKNGEQLKCEKYFERCPNSFFQSVN